MTSPRNNPDIIRQITSCNTWDDFEKSQLELNTKQKGDSFEELTRLYFLSDPVYATKIKKIWHHSEIPQNIIDELELVQPEIGVDLIAEVRDGSYWAIQCKFHQVRSNNVSNDELASFFAITNRKNTAAKLSHRLVCTSADGISRGTKKTQLEKIGYITSSTFTDLGKEEFNGFKKLIDDTPPDFSPYTPRVHQSNALNKCVEYFDNGIKTRGKIIHPCGSGKSLTGFWLSQKLNAKTVLLAVPSLALVRQTLGLWAREAIASGVDMDWIAVCSDNYVGNSDDPLMKSVDLGIEVDTDPQFIANFLSKNSKSIKVLVTTYQSGKAVSAGANLADAIFDLGIYDEAHKTVGQKDKAFAHLLSDDNVKVSKRVFMTATERQFRGNSDEYVSMDNENIYGSLIDQLSFKKALEQNPPILSDYKIVSTIVTKKEIEQLINHNDFVKPDGAEWDIEADASTLTALIALRKLIKKYNLKHTISFHNSIKRAKEFQELNANVNANNLFDNLDSFHVNGKLSTGKRSAELKRFIDTEPSLITNARCLTEGVDVPAIDTVLFADPKQSKIDIIQAAGRALRKFDDKEFGYIIIPTFIDEDTDNPSDEAFSQIVTTISALGMNDSRIIDEFKEIANGRHNGRGRIVIFDVPELIRVNFEEFISNIGLQIWDRLSFGWVKGFEKLTQYIKTHKDARIPIAYIDADDFSLGSWVNERRGNYKTNILDTDHTAQLNALNDQYNLSPPNDWVWNIEEAEFQYGFEKLTQYIKTHNSARVPRRYTDADDFALGSWAGARRSNYNNNALDTDRAAQFNALNDQYNLSPPNDWVWDIEEAEFQYGFEKLTQYIKTHNSARVPGTYKDADDFTLGSWVSTRRREHKNNTLSTDRIALFNTLNEQFDLSPPNDWVWRYNNL